MGRSPARLNGQPRSAGRLPTTVTDNVNQAKGDDGPEAWKPPLSKFSFSPADNDANGLASYYCTYAKMWVRVKYVYDLTITSAEKNALVSMLDTC